MSRFNSPLDRIAISWRRHTTREWLTLNVLVQSVCVHGQLCEGLYEWMHVVSVEYSVFPCIHVIKLYGLGTILIFEKLFYYQLN